jgi:serine protease
MMIGLGASGPEAVRAALAAGAVPQDDASLFGAGILNAGASATRLFWLHEGFRALALLVLGSWVIRRIKKRGGVPVSKASMAPGALLGGLGLLPVLPLLHLLPRLGAHRWLGELAMRPLGEWDVVWDAGLHRWLPLANALPVVALTVLMFGVRRMRPTIGGLALGVSALLTQLAVQGDVATPFGPLATRLWLVANVILCLWIGRLALDGKRA